jgi:hypothetical protein
MGLYGHASLAQAQSTRFDDEQGARDYHEKIKDERFPESEG